MNGKVRLAVLILTAAVSFVCVSLPVFAARPEEKPVQPALEGAAREYPEPEENKYILKEHNNCISVFYGDERVKDTKINISRLRAHDREILADGIMVNSYGEVLSLLEDFES